MEVLKLDFGRVYTRPFFCLSKTPLAAIAEGKEDVRSNVRRAGGGSTTLCDKLTPLG